MPDLPPSALDARQQKLVENARTALARGNPDYVLAVCEPLLRSVPACVAVRRQLRAAQLLKHRSHHSLFARALSGLSVAPFAFGGGSRNPAEQFERVEKLLAADPTNVTALKLQAAAAAELDWRETVVFLREAVREFVPADRDNLLALGEAWLAVGRPDEALRLADEILRDRPVDGEAQNLMRKASIATTVAKGNWEGAGNYRQKLHDATQATALEQTARQMSAAETTREQLPELLARAAASPEDAPVRLVIARHYRQLGQNAEAKHWLEQAWALSAGAGDPAMAKLAEELRLDSLQARAADSAEARAELAAHRMGEARAAVERYPNDPEARFALAELLHADGQVEPAIAQYQQAQKSPKLRVRALLGLARCFKARRLPDLAVAQLQTAKGALAGMDDLKKEVTYELGACLELMGQPENAIAQFKAIYAEDIAFRDVADKINTYYTKAGPD